jgi:4-hydroxy-3-methylbut-2-enyl diphosphate reductase
MNIIIADYSGFCFGVERAISIAYDAATRYENVRTYGPIIHNPQVVERLESKNIKVINNIDEIKSNDLLIIRSHGITKKLYDELLERDIKIIDATCPFVKKAYNAARLLSDEDYFVVILGDKEHPEVEGIISYIKREYLVISNVSEALSLPFKEKIGYIAQTTQERKLFRDIGVVLRNRCNSLKIVDTICNATFQRQSSAKKVAKKVDIMLIIGGKNSANTRRLYTICSHICSRTYLIEKKEDLAFIDIKDAINLGISAGASTPDYVIKEVLEYLKEVDYVR